ncbi:MAG: ParA family protein [Acidimicrobiales bacterium]
MDDERGVGGYRWSTVGQLAPDRPEAEVGVDDRARAGEEAEQPERSGIPVDFAEVPALEPNESEARAEPDLGQLPPDDPGLLADVPPIEVSEPESVPETTGGGHIGEKRNTETPEVALAPAFAAPPPASMPAPGHLLPPTPPLPPVDSLPATPPAPTSARPPSAVVRPLPRIMAIANQKGGVGKTTTAVNLGAALAELGYRVLVIDLDPQGNATTGLGINARNLQSSIYDVLLNDLSLEDCIEPTAVRNLFLAPATIDLAGAEIELVPAFSRELRLRRALERLGDDYDFTLIDCPPSLGLLTVNGLAAATEVVVPIQCEYYALEGLGQLLRNVELVQRNLNPTLDLGAIILTMFDARTKLSDQVTKEVRQHFGPKVCRNIVPRTVRLSEAPSFGQPIIVFDSTSRGAIAYRELAKEVSGGATRRSG